MTHVDRALTDRKPLIVVSNRLPHNLRRKPFDRPSRRNVGGLVTALEPVLAERGGGWVGWDGSPLPTMKAVAAALAFPLAQELASGATLHGVPISERDLALYYNGFCNRAIWPLFHDFPGRAAFAPDEFAAYQRINKRFAEVTLERAGDRSRIWVHDFQLMLVPRYLRQFGFKGRLDFFLHIPFPPPEIFRAVPWRAEILAGLLAADAVAFHVPLYRDNFVQCATSLARAQVAGDDAEGATVVTSEGGRTAACAIPIGIPVDEFESIARRPEVSARAQRLREAHGNCRILFSADRLDYTKGIRERLRCVEHFLKLHPEYNGKIVLLQVVVPSRHQVEEYRVMKREIDRVVGRINGELGREGWMPIHYRYTALDREELVAHYLAADVALVTPLRDGMNLVASEFAAARTDEDGVLLISEFAGIADRSPGAILVNPYDLDGCAAAIAAALAMDRFHRRERMVRLRQRVRANPVSRWARRCLERVDTGAVNAEAVVDALEPR
jgi:alpha,alpha-trehalose-phosphate synthase [UDP-forming]